MDTTHSVRNRLPIDWMKKLTTARAVDSRRLVLGFVVLVVCCSLPPILNYCADGSMKDYPLWYETGQTVLRGERIYPIGESFPFMYPPIAAILMAPLSIAGLFPMVLALIAINSLAWAAAVILSVYL